jgi:hypothetical protein
MMKTIFAFGLSGFLSFAFALRADETSPVIHWSNYTNGVRVGISLETNVTGSSCAVFTQVAGTSFDRLWLPSVEDMLKIELTDSSGNKVQKTEKGKLFGLREPAHVFEKVLPRRSVVLRDKPSIVADVNLHELFVITNYQQPTLTLQVRLLRMKTSTNNTSIRETFVFPPIHVNTELVPASRRRSASN